jgi:hypothetical protein
MICYTNHALDQFLEYCIDQCSLTHGVVRVGGQSKSEKLDVFKLSNIKRHLRSGRQIEANIHHRIIEEKDKLVEMKKDLESSTKALGIVTFGNAMLRFSVLENFIDDVYKNQIEIDSKKGADYSFLQWLGFFEEVEKELTMFQDAQVDIESEEIIDGINALTLEDNNQNAALAEEEDFEDDDSNYDDIYENTDRIGNFQNYLSLNHKHNLISFNL